MDENGVIKAFEISEKSLLALAPDFEDDDVVRIDADAAEKFVAKLQKAMSKVASPKLIVPMEMRHLMFMLLSHYMNEITVLSREEISCSATLEIAGEI
jgi:flagellar biosynthesis component FlhA